MTLGLTDGTNNFGLSNSQPAGGSNLTSFTGDYGRTLPSSRTGNTSPNYTSNMGITTDETKSGIILNRTNSKYLNFFIN